MNKFSKWVFCGMVASLGVWGFFEGSPGQEKAKRQPPQQKKDSLDRDYSGELPRIKSLSPKEALKSFRVAAGFQIEQAAAEPIVTDPVAMAFDEDGRLFVVEMRGYSEDGEKNLGRIRLLEDLNGDGRFDNSTVFVDGLSWPTAATCYDGGLFVGAAPDIWYFKDTNGDNRADVRQKVFTGFGRSNVQGLLNTFKWGIDNRLHGAVSSSGAQVQRLDQNGKPIGEALVLKGRDFALNPRTMTMQAVSGGGQHGLSFNQWGEKFVCSNSNHCQYVQFDDRYLARNPYLASPSSRISIAADGPQADVFRTSPVEPWRIVRTRLRRQKLVPGPLEGGGTAAGYFTGATGVTIYRGSAWPAKYYGWAIVGDVGSNLVHRKRLQRDGVAYKAQRVDQKSEFLSSSDIWFRPVQFANAPDGALYIADMYREVIEHPLSLPPVIKKHLDLTNGRDRGRIYRVAPAGFQQPPAPKLSSAGTPELVALLEHPNGWHRETAARLLFERQDTRSISPLEKLAQTSKRPEGKIHALWALEALIQQGSALSAETVLRALDDDHPRVREHAVRLAERIAGDSPAVRQRLFEMAQDPDLRVRYQLAFSLGSLSDPRRIDALAQIAQMDNDKALFRLAIQSSLREGAGLVLARLAKSNERSRPRSVWAGSRRLIENLARQIGRQQRSDDVANLLGTMQSLAKTDEATLSLIVKSLGVKRGSPLDLRIAAATGGKAEQVTQQMLAEARKTALAEKAAARQRVAAIRTLKIGQWNAATTETLEALLAPAEPAAVQSAAIETLSSFNEDRGAELLLARFRQFTPPVRARAGDALFSRSRWVAKLLTALEKEEIKVADLEPGRLRLLAAHPNDQVRRRAAALIKRGASSSRAAVVEQYQTAFKMKGDLARGKQIHKKVCSQCHQVEGVGFNIGPNLAAMKNRGPETILVNVLDPNREVNPQYLNYTVNTQEGRSLTGMISAETATSITLTRAENKSDTVLRIDIDEIRSTGLSLMPEGMEKEVNQQAMADLIAYLMSL